MNHIELFAGCGGLSLGLEYAGFELVLANELSPMAGETFAYNFLDEDLDEVAAQNKDAEHTFWINSQYQQLKPRLRENPFTFPRFGQAGFSDLPINGDWNKLDGKLIIGSIIDLNKCLEANPDFLDKVCTAFGRESGLDLVSGGPPCQSFSMAGKRERDNEKNTLPWAFARFVELSRPKIALLENVTGILRPFSGAQGVKFHAWYEVAKVFSSIGYVPLCLHLNARFSGVAQNRPRFVMIAVRADHLTAIRERFSPADAKLFEEAWHFHALVQEQQENLPFGYLNYIDLTRVEGMSYARETFLSDLIDNPEVSVAEAIDDLKIQNRSEPSEFVRRLNATFDRLHLDPMERQQIPLFNHEHRSNSAAVRSRFRLYQVLAQVSDRRVTKSVFDLLRFEKSKVKELTDTAWQALKGYDFMQESGELSPFDSKLALESYLLKYPTKKRTQKALIAESPAPAALSIPDDACHYDPQELRVLTVREMARIQSFPDNFVFRSKITTGGQMRRFEVPQYTQVGNAVPPLLGLRLGYVLAKLL